LQKYTLHFHHFCLYSILHHAFLCVLEIAARNIIRAHMSPTDVLIIRPTDIASITESWSCIDCGINTAPGCPDGPTLRRELVLKREVPIYFDDNTEVYAVRDRVWKQARMKPFDGCLCIQCLEARLGRKLKPKDFPPDDELNVLPGSPRLLNRRQRR
jgi:hypothetical protein